MHDITLYLDNTHSVGLGDNLCFLSALANLPPKVNVWVSNHHSTFDRLTQLATVFQIPTDSVQFFQHHTQTGSCHNTGWPLKLLSDYHKPAQVQANGKLLSTHTGDEKRCVALAGFYDMPKDPVAEQEFEQNCWPWCKHRPIEHYAKIFAWLKSMEYDVITVDRYWSLERKIQTMVENCCAVISYEGGMAHLSHMLSMPCFLIDWKHPSPSTKLSNFHCDFVHMTDSVHVLRNDHELFDWTYDDFNHRIKQLRQGQGNNRFTSRAYSIYFRENSICKSLEVLDKNGASMLAPVHVMNQSNSIASFLDQYYLKKSV